MTSHFHNERKETKEKIMLVGMLVGVLSVQPAPPLHRALLVTARADARLIAAGSSEEQLRRDWTAAFESQPLEFDRMAVPVVSGAVPEDLRGTLFKNGPALFSRGGTAAPA